MPCARVVHGYRGLGFKHDMMYSVQLKIGLNFVGYPQIDFKMKRFKISPRSE